MFQNIFYCDKYFIDDEVPSDNFYIGYMHLISPQGEKITTFVMSRIPFESYMINRYIYGNISIDISNIKKSNQILGIHQLLFVGKIVEKDYSGLFVENDFMSMRIDGYNSVHNRTIPVRKKELDNQGFLIGDIVEIEYKYEDYSNHMFGYGNLTQDKPNHDFIFRDFDIFTSSSSPEPLMILKDKKEGFGIMTLEQAREIAKDWHFGGVR